MDVKQAPCFVCLMVNSLKYMNRYHQKKRTYSLRTNRLPHLNCRQLMDVESNVLVL